MSISIQKYKPKIYRVYRNNEGIRYFEFYLDEVLKILNIDNFVSKYGSIEEFDNEL